MISLQPTASVPIAVGGTAPGLCAKTETQTHRPKAAVPSVPAALFTPKIHPRVAEVTAEVDAFFLKHWPFEHDKARKKFVAAGFSAVTCLYFPEALDDRIAFACRLLALLFLVDGEYSSFQRSLPDRTAWSNLNRLS
jgi:hypothetical protein